ncbi:MAG: KpsF/GutQ family sugar-phosphate isomerase [Burkholderiales bacterium]
MNHRASDEVARTAARQSVDAPTTLARARQVLAIEAKAIADVAARLGDAFVRAVELILDCRGRVVVCGIGKSGHVGRKLAATLASTGTPAFFVHATEAMHGDLGMVTAEDVVVMLSNSGETAELSSLLPHVKRAGAHVVAITGNAQSSLAQAAHIHLDAHVDEEACPLGLAPTASTTATQALGDALALALLDARGFSAQDFLRSHPAGALGRRLVRVREVMRSGAALPTTRAGSSISDAIAEMSAKGMGMTVVVDDDLRVAGIFTDGDLRRCVGSGRDLARATVDDVMTRTPRAVGPDDLAIDCVEVMETPPKVMLLLVVDGEGKLAGALHMHDLFKARIV